MYILHIQIWFDCNFCHFLSCFCSPAALAFRPQPLSGTSCLCKDRPLQWRASYMCRPHGVETSTRCFLFHLRKQGEQRTMRCHFWTRFCFVLRVFFSFVQTGAFFFSPPPVLEAMLISHKMSPCLTGVFGFHSGTVMEGTVGWRWPSPPVTHYLAHSHGGDCFGPGLAVNMNPLLPQPTPKS